MTPAEAGTLAALAERLARGDPDRHLAAMAAPVAARAVLLVLYAFNLELARVPWVTKDPLLARMRLQFWHDAVDEAEHPRAHEVAGPLAGLITGLDLPRALFHQMIAAREADLEPAPFGSEAELWSYLEATAGGLMVLAVRALGGAAAEVARDFGAAQGMANYLMAVPALAAAGRHPLPADDPETIEALAGGALIRLERARFRRAEVAGPARPALLAAWRARAVLAQAAAHPERVAAGDLGQSEFARRGSLLWASWFGV